MANIEGKVTNKRRNCWGEGFIWDYQAAQILPNVPVYPPRPAMSFCKEAAASHMCPEGPVIPGQHRVAIVHVFWESLNRFQNWEYPLSNT